MSEESLNKAIVGLAKELTNTEEKSEPIRYGTAKKDANGNLSVVLDGGDPNNPTPAVSSIDIEDGTRVSVEFINRQLIITGSTMTPAMTVQAANGLFEKVDAKFGEFENLYAEKAEVGDLVAESIQASDIIVKKADIDELEADVVNVKDTLAAQNATIGNLEGDIADFRLLETDYAQIKIGLVTSGLMAENGEFTNVIAKKADVDALAADVVNVKDTLTTQNATIGNLEGDIADFRLLETDYAQIKIGLVTSGLMAEDGEFINLSAEYADINFAKISDLAANNLYSKAGTIGAASIDKEGIHVAGDVTGIHIYGDVIEADTIKANSLLIQGENGLYYKLNTILKEDDPDNPDIDWEAISEDDLQTKLHGSNIIANTITADQIYVDDLSALDATIGGFHISQGSVEENKPGAIYSGVKQGIENTTNGVYMDDEGQFYLGNNSSYLKFYKYTKEDGTEDYKLDISASSLKMSTGTLDLGQIEQAIDDASKVATNYLQFDSDGLVIGDLQSSSVTDNVLITDTSVEIRKNEIAQLEIQNYGLFFYGLTETSDGKQKAKHRGDIITAYNDSTLSFTSEGPLFLGTMGATKNGPSMSFEQYGTRLIGPQTNFSDTYRTNIINRHKINNQTYTEQISLNAADVIYGTEPDLGHLTLSVHKAGNTNKSSLDIKHDGTIRLTSSDNDNDEVKGQLRFFPSGNGYLEGHNALTLIGGSSTDYDNSSYLDLKQNGYLNLNSRINGVDNGKLVFTTSGDASLSSKHAVYMFTRSSSDSTVLNKIGIDEAQGIVGISAENGIYLKTGANNEAFITKITTDSAGNLFVDDQLNAQLANGNGYWGIKLQSNNTFLRTPPNGLIPCYPGTNESHLGTAGWPFLKLYVNDAYIQNTLNVRGLRYEFESGWIDWGSVPANTHKSYTITFKKVFANIPSVVATLRWNGSSTSVTTTFYVSCSNETTTSAIIHVYNSGSAAHSMSVDWIAMGRTWN